MTTDCKEVFGQLLRYFSESDDKRMCANIQAFAQACLAVGEFDAAEKYADILLVQDNGGAAQQISACRIKLFCRLKCKNDDDFLHCPAFNKDMEEYQNLIVVCADDARSLKMYIQMANANAETVAQDESRRLEQEALARQRRAEEEKQRQLELSQERALRREKCRELCTSFLIIFFFVLVPISLLIIGGFVLWGSDMNKSLKCLLAMLCFLGAGILSGLLFRAEMYDENIEGKWKQFSELSGKGWIAFLLLIFSAIMTVILLFISNSD